MLVSYKMNLDRLNVGRVILFLGGFPIVFNFAVVSAFTSLVECEAMFVLLVLRPRYDLKEAQLSAGNSMFLLLNIYFLMISNMLVTHSLLFGFNNVLALCKISLWHLELFFAG
jgi:hypothetical protein